MIMKNKSGDFMDQKLKDHFTDRMSTLPPNAGVNRDYHVRKMADRLCNEFDDIWLKCEKGEATFNQWKQALDKWLKAECI